MKQNKLAFRKFCIICKAIQLRYVLFRFSFVCLSITVRNLVNFVYPKDQPLQTVVNLHIVQYLYGGVIFNNL